jgi:SAM-dependent methyltransferase
MDQSSLIDLGKKYFDVDGCKTWKMYRLYEPHLSPLRDRTINILELGVFSGSSLEVWNEYFSNATIVGLDINPVVRNFSPRISFVQGSQDDTTLLKEMSERFAPDGWDVIVDDASHVGYYSKRSFWYLFMNHLKPGGFYFIEDWGTGYWEDWPDGKRYEEPIEEMENDQIPKRFPSHDHGMVGLVKQLVDEAGRNAIHTLSNQPSDRRTYFEHMDINYGFVLVQKKYLTTL